MRQKIMLLAMVTTMSLTVMPPVYANSSMTDSDSQSESEQSVSQNETESSTSENQVTSESTEVEKPPTTSQTERTESENSTQAETRMTEESEDALAQAVADVMRDLPKMELDPTRGPGYYEVETNSRSKRSVSTTSATAVTNTQAFLNKIKAGAISGWKKYKVLPSLTGSQAVLESGWGSSGLSTSANNLFGIKGRYNNQYELWPTAEYINGQWVTVNAEFRKYPSWKESMEDHGKFLVDNSRYAKVLGQKDYKKATQLIWEAGYATDPDYPGKLQSTIEYNNLVAWDKEAFEDTVNLANYYTSNPKKVVTKKADYSYKGVEFTTANRVKNYASGTILTVTAIEKSKNGTPRLQLSDGTYFTAHRSNVQQLVSNVANYYTTNPSKIIMKKDDYAYNTTEFNTGTRNKLYKKGAVLNVKSISYSANGTPRLLLTNGLYLTAHQSNVVKAMATISKYYTTNPKTIIMKKDDYVYKTTEFNTGTRGALQKKGQVLTVKAIVYSANWTPRLQLSNGTYVSAHTSNVVKAMDTIAKYYTTNPKKINMKRADYAYSSPEFNAKTKVKQYAASTLLNVKAIEYSSDWIPRLLLTNGLYVSAHQSNVVKSLSNIDNYYTSNPGTIIMKKDDYAYKTTEFNTSTRGALQKKGTVLKVTGIVYSANMTPRLKLSNGTFISAHTSNVVKAMDTIGKYYTTNPSTIIMKKDDYVYKTTEFNTNTRGKLQKKGTVLKVTGIVYSANWTPRLKLNDGTFVSAHTSNVVKAMSNIANYYTTNPKKIIMVKDDYAYKTTEFNTGTRGKLHKKGAVLNVTAVTYSANWTPRLKLSDGSFISAHQSNVKKQ
ncbi:glycoside hydrolase family 73 protein [Brochothrix campestris]|uniref:Mannosyl-glycoprotein endo-beta-N-acetylglucosamidase-like domain-containing protein n=1 Tax=Brochothrix campestris FSL F6-1037 TaxID=1265861 RepID=W7CPH7_9LIST|nr:glycoside hydrolase family 73 protein [Brochothrix campestris]EUJ37621.1 hypothetical protein BCAMP_09665 [Brochothrix campestris FSL F6-1037]